MARREVTPRHTTSRHPAKTKYTAPEDEPKSEATRKAIKENFETRPEDKIDGGRS